MATIAAAHRFPRAPSVGVSARLHLLVRLVIGIAVISPTAAMGQASYVVEDLGALSGDASSVAWAINAHGDVVGWSMGPNGTRAFVYTTAGGMVELPSLPGRPRSVARDINDAGNVVGSANAGGVDLGHAVLWSEGSVRDLGTLGTGAFSEAWGINNFGQIVGTSYTDGGAGLLGVHGFLYTPGLGLRDITPQSDGGAATDINDFGEVTGYKTAFGGYHAFRWQNGAFLDLGVLPGFAHSFGWAISALGGVTGSSSSASGNSERFIRFTDERGLQDLGGAGEHNAGRGINEMGDVVGCTGQSQSRAIRYTDEAGLQNLNALIDPSLGWVLLCAHDINDARQIVGYAFNNHTGRTHAVRLQPADMPPPECTLNCLRSTSIVLRSQRDGDIVGRVTVQDENGAPVPRALVLGRWTHPDGSSHDQYVPTGTKGRARFTTSGPAGRYTLMIVNILLSQYTFNPSESVLTKSITVVR